MVAMATRPLDINLHGFVRSVPVQSGALQRVQDCGACEPPGAHWHVVAVEYQADGLAALSIANISPAFDVRTFWVEEHQPRTALRPARTLLTLAFPGYLIVRWDAQSDPWQRIRRARGVAGILTGAGQPDRPAILPDLAVAILLSRCDERGVLDARQPEPLEDYSGEELEVADHPWLGGLTGICVRSGADRVKILLSFLGGEREVELTRAAVRRVQR